MTESDFVVEDVTDPDEIRRSYTQDQRHRRNSDWLQAHWADVLPQACGKFVAVAGQETFIADTPTEAWAWVDDVHPGGRKLMCVGPVLKPRFKPVSGKSKGQGCSHKRERDDSTLNGNPVSLLLRLGASKPVGCAR